MLSSAIWKKTIMTALLAASLLLTAASPAAAEADLTQLVRDVEPAVLFITMYDKDGEIYGLGSGFFVSPEGEFLTNRHVLKDAYYAMAMSPNGKTYPVTKIISIHPEADLVKAVVGNVTEPVPYLRISREGVVKGQRIYVFGNPTGLTFTVSDGIVSGFRSLPRFGDVFQMTAPISGGSSGGPVVNASGEVVGISVAEKKTGQNLNFAVLASAIGALVTPSGGPLVLSQESAGPQQKQPAGTPKRPSDSPKRYLFIASYPEYDAYLDTGTIALIHNRDADTYRIEFWIRDVYKAAGKAKIIEMKAKEGQGEKFFNFSAMLTHMRVNPATAKFTLLRVIFYNDRGGVIDTVEFKHQVSREDPVAPGTLIEKVVGVVLQIIKAHPDAVNMVSE